MSQIREHLSGTWNAERGDSAKGEKHCPNLIPNRFGAKHHGILFDSGLIKVDVRFQPDHIPHYKTLAGLRNDWYMDF